MRVKQNHSQTPWALQRQALSEQCQPEPDLCRKNDEYKIRTVMAEEDPWDGFPFEKRKKKNTSKKRKSSSQPAHKVRQICGP
jgi:hypothetical protein